MKTSSCLLGMLSFVSQIAIAAELDTRQITNQQTYVFCEFGQDCPQRTQKYLDVGQEAENVSAGSTINPLPLNTKELSVMFDLRSSRIGKKEWTNLLEAVQSRQFSHIYVTGYTDRVGNKSYNQRLAKRRSQAVHQALLTMGVKSRSIKVKSQCCIGYPPDFNPMARKVFIQFVDN